MYNPQRKRKIVFIDNHELDIIKKMCGAKKLAWVPNDLTRAPVAPGSVTPCARPPPSTIAMETQGSIHFKHGVVGNLTEILNDSPEDPEDGEICLAADLHEKVNKRLLARIS